MASNTAPAAPTDSALPPSAATAAHAAVTSSIEKDAADKTVFDSPTDFTVKHPLYSPWTLWFDSASRQVKAQSWDDALTEVSTVSSVEEFWGLYNNIVAPSVLSSSNSNYYLFKKGVKPAWEDPANEQGGKWAVQLPRGKYTESVDMMWLNTMLAAIGETFETPFTSTSAPSSPASAASPSPLPSSFSNEITGVIVSARKAFFRINIWTRSSSASSEGEGKEDLEKVKERIENIGRHFKYGILGFVEGKASFGDRDKVSSDVEFASHHGPKGKWTV
ncbi:hypothetical protein JCM11641_007795 [Rhodosporidiobolus odoratus]